MWRLMIELKEFTCKVYYKHHRYHFYEVDQKQGFITYYELKALKGQYRKSKVIMFHYFTKCIQDILKGKMAEIVTDGWFYSLPILYQI